MKRDSRAVQRDKRLRRKYGISLKQYEEMLRAQNGVCWICHHPPKKRALAVDHNHKTGKVRGLLCSNCNYGISRYFKEKPEHLRRAAEYLEKFNTDNQQKLVIATT